MTHMEQIAKLIEKHPGKTAGELTEISGLNDAQVASAIAQCMKRSFVRRERRNATSVRPNIGIWIYFAS